MKLKKICKNKLAFTLVELVVVIAILAILASVATVATIAILNNARKTPVETLSTTIKTAVTVALSSNEVTTGSTDDQMIAAIKNGVTDANWAANQPAKNTSLNNATTKPTQPSGDGMYAMVSSRKPVTISGSSHTVWYVIVYSQYYWIGMTIDATDMTVTIGETNKF